MFRNRIHIERDICQQVQGPKQCSGLSLVACFTQLLVDEAFLNLWRSLFLLTNHGLAKTRSELADA